MMMTSGDIIVPDMGIVRWRLNCAWVAANVTDSQRRLLEETRLSLARALPDALIEMLRVAAAVGDVSRRAEALLRDCHLPGTLRDGVRHCLIDHRTWNGLTCGIEMLDWAFVSRMFRVAPQLQRWWNEPGCRGMALQFASSWQNGATCWTNVEDLKNGVVYDDNALIASSTNMIASAIQVNVTGAVQKLMDDAMEAARGLRRFVLPLGRAYCRHTIMQLAQSEHAISRAMMRLHRWRWAEARARLISHPVMLEYARRCICDPAHPACRKRLVREWNELTAMTFGSII